MTNLSASPGIATAMSATSSVTARLTLLCVGCHSELEPARNLADRLRLQGEEAVLLLAPTLQDVDTAGAELAPLRKGWWRRGPGGLWWLRKLIRRLQPDRVVVGGFTTAAVAAVLAGRVGSTALAVFEPLPFCRRAVLNQGLGVEVCLRSWLTRQLPWRTPTSLLLAGSKRAAH